MHYDDVLFVLQYIGISRNGLLKSINLRNGSDLFGEKIGGEII